MKTRLGDYTAFRDATTVASLYDDNPTDPARLNFTTWIKELHKTITE